MPRRERRTKKQPERKTLMERIFESQRAELNRLNEEIRVKVNRMTNFENARRRY